MGDPAPLLGIMDFPAFARAVAGGDPAVNDRLSALQALPRIARLRAVFHRRHPAFRGRGPRRWAAGLPGVAGKAPARSRGSPAGDAFASGAKIFSTNKRRLGIDGIDGCRPLASEVCDRRQSGSKQR